MTLLNAQLVTFATDFEELESSIEKNSTFKALEGPSLSAREISRWTAVRLHSGASEQLFQLASAHAISVMRNSSLCITNDRIDSQIHDLVYFHKEFSTCPEGHFEEVTESGFAKYDPNLFQCRGNISVGRYLQSYKYFASNGVPFMLKTKTWAERWVQQNGINVGIHILRGVDDSMRAENGVKPAPLLYFEYCLHKLQGHIRSIKAVIITNDRAWVRRQPLFANMTLLDGKPQEDIAVLAACPHIVSSIGALGWWAMYFKSSDSGERFYYANPWDYDVVPEYRSKFSASDHFLPWWTGVGDKELELFRSSPEYAQILYPGGNKSAASWTAIGLHQQLGNQMFQLASACGIAKSRRSRVCVFGGLEGTLLAAAVDLTEEIPACPKLQLALKRERGFAKFDEDYIQGQGSIAVGTYLQSFKYFEELPQLPFKLKTKVWAEDWVKQNSINVGIHIRRGDFDQPSSCRRTAPLIYFEYCLHKLRQKIGSIKAVILTNDLAWVRRHPLFANMVIHAGKPAEDMAVLAACPHIVASVGTFGWWAMFLKSSVAGARFYFADPWNLRAFPLKGTTFNASDHFLPWWTGVGDQELKLFRNSSEYAQILYPGGNKSAASWTAVRLHQQLGDQMFQLASACGIAKSRQSRVCVFGGLARTLLATVVDLTEEIPECPKLQLTLKRERGFARFDKHMIMGQSNIAVGTYLQSFKYFERAPFKLKTIMWASYWVQTHGIQVGIHVCRKTCYGGTKGFKPAPLLYFEYCLHKLGQRISNILSKAIIVTDDLEWVGRQPLFANMTLVKGKPGQEMAKLAACTHIVSSVGTFGWWAMWLKRAVSGERFYYADPWDYNVVPEYRSEFTVSDHFLPWWTGVGDQELALFRSSAQYAGIQI